MTFLPDEVKIVDVILIGIMEAYLSFIPIILQLPVGDVMMRCTDSSGTSFIQRESPMIILWKVFIFNKMINELLP